MTAAPSPSSPPPGTNRAAQLLAESVEKLMDSETFKAALSFRKKLYHYSFNNVWLIYCQCPTVSYVAGYRRWQELGRQVKKGEKAIAILAPLIKKTEEGEKEVFGFRAASVFDLAQTEGRVLPAFPKPELLTAEGDNYHQIIEQLKAFALARGFKVIMHDVYGANGLFHLKSKTIYINHSLSASQKLKTFVHELAHALMHTEGTASKRHVYELEAESCAFLVCDSLGLDTSRYTFPYLAGWASDPREVLPAAERACRTADCILEVLRLEEFLLTA